MSCIPCIVSYLHANFSISFTNSGSGFIPKSISIISFIALKPVTSINAETSKLTYPSIDTPANLAIRVEISTADVETESDILS